ncbi:glycine-rich domain-containing protein [Imhoffiella purpurea]|uniref:Uncharacterized protein n=1 Tax=Imhoffiella purpurea TaxID=1249627 RepID=W9V1X9_9GAMM|nr:hypothetical protein [Imhoffiella purpurea]EXJ13498.1 hypothetical protein D779_3663 [Imhoffiella purpurea]
MTGLAIIVGLILLFLLARLGAARMCARRAAFIRSYDFPGGLLDRFAARHPELSAHDRHLVSRALRQFFLAYLSGGRKPVSMPSQVTDDLWHDFILFTRHYRSFCRRAFGRFLHHTPAIDLGPDRRSNDGLRRVWWHACQIEGIDPGNPARLPLLFALDERLAIEEGFHYALDRYPRRALDEDTPIHYVGDLTTGGFDASGGGFLDSLCGGWDGGDGCGGDGGGCGGD